MKKNITFVAFFTLLVLSSNLIEAKEKELSLFTSSYTSIEEKDCLTLDSDNLGSIQECEPFSEIKVKVIEGDIRQSITLTRNSKEYVLNLQAIVSPAFSTLAKKIEWRHKISKSEMLKGMIVRLEVSDDFENPEKVSPYLIVSKITGKEICVIAKILPQDKQNEIAREILDSSEDKPCLKRLK